MEDRRFIIGAIVICGIILVPTWIFMAKTEYDVYTKKPDASGRAIGGKKTKRTKGKRQSFRKCNH